MVVIALTIFLVVSIFPNVDINTLSTTDKLMYDLGIYEAKTPIWKVICYIIASILGLIAMIVEFVMCRCPNCRKYIFGINIFTNYCPYCSKNLNKTK